MIAEDQIRKLLHGAEKLVNVSRDEDRDVYERLEASVAAFDTVYSLFVVEGFLKKAAEAEVHAVFCEDDVELSDLWLKEAARMRAEATDAMVKAGRE